MVGPTQPPPEDPPRDDPGKPQFRVVQGVDGGVIVVLNHAARYRLVDFLRAAVRASGRTDRLMTALRTGLAYPTLVQTTPGTCRWADPAATPVTVPTGGDS